MKEFFKIRSKKANRARIQVITIAVSLMLVAAIAIGGTVAWLVDTTESVTNTFTFGDIDITLKETKATDSTVLDADNQEQKNEYANLVPGKKVPKNPTVTFLKDSVACYVFIKVKKSANFNDFFTATIDTSIWKTLPNENNVYYCVVNEAEAKSGKELKVLKDDQVTVNSNVTKAMINSLTDATYPTITFTAYAIQSENLGDTANETTAWDLLNAQLNSSNPQP